MLPRLYPNQKAIRTIKAPANSDNLYAIFNLTAMNRAARELNGSELKLWMYFNSHQDGYEFGLSTKDIAEKYGMDIKTVRAAVNKLIEKEYLIEVELYPGLTGYCFIEEGWDSKKTRLTADLINNDAAAKDCEQGGEE